MTYHDWVKRWRMSPTPETNENFLMWLLKRVEQCAIFEATANSTLKTIIEIAKDCTRYSKACEYHLQIGNVKNFDVANWDEYEVLGADAFKWFVPSFDSNVLIRNTWISLGWGEFLNEEVLEALEGRDLDVEFVQDDKNKFVARVG